MKKKIALLSAVLLLTAAAAILPACSSEQTAEITSPALVSKVTQYYADAGTDELTWTEVSSSEYQYENGYPTALTRTAYDEVTAIDFKYEFENGLPVSMTESSPDLVQSYSTSYTPEGLVDRVLTYDDTGRKIGEQIFEYGNRDEYFTLVLHENVISPPEETVVDHMEEVDSVMITSENGLLRKTVNDGLFANYNDDEEKIWRTFDGTYTANYNDAGILDTTSAIFKTFPNSGNQYKFDLTVENGRITEAVRSNWEPADTTAAEDDPEAIDAAANEDNPEASDAAATEDDPEASDAAANEEGTWVPEYKFVFEYTDEEISPARYASMINYFLLEGGGNYYIYNWY